MVNGSSHCALNYILPCSSVCYRSYLNLHIEDTVLFIVRFGFKYFDNLFILTKRENFLFHNVSIMEKFHCIQRTLHVYNSLTLRIGCFFFFSGMISQPVSKLGTYPPKPSSSGLAANFSSPSTPPNCKPHSYKIS